MIYIIRLIKCAHVQSRRFMRRPVKLLSEFHKWGGSENNKLAESIAIKWQEVVFLFCFLLRGVSLPLSFMCFGSQLDKNHIGCIEDGAFRAMRGLEVL